MQKIDIHSTDASGGNIIPGREDGNNDLGNGSTYRIYRNNAATNSGSQQYFAKDKDGNVEPISAPGGGISSVVHDGTLSGNGTISSPLGLPYKVYVSIISQIGTNAPTEILLENTLGVTISYAYNAVGNYSIVASSSIFVDFTKTIVLTGQSKNVGIINQFVTSDTTIGLSTWDYTISPADGVLSVFPIEIRVYP